MPTDALDCPSASRLLDALEPGQHLDLHAFDELNAHAATCPECCARWQAARATLNICLLCWEGDLHRHCARCEATFDYLRLPPRRVRRPGTWRLWVILGAVLIAVGLLVLDTTPARATALTVGLATTGYGLLARSLEHRTRFCPRCRWLP